MFLSFQTSFSLTSRHILVSPFLTPLFSFSQSQDKQSSSLARPPIPRPRAAAAGTRARVRPYHPLSSQISFFFSALCFSDSRAFQIDDRIYSVAFPARHIPRLFILPCNTFLAIASCILCFLILSSVPASHHNLTVTGLASHVLLW